MTKFDEGVFEAFLRHFGLHQTELKNSRPTVIKHQTHAFIPVTSILLGIAL